MSRKGKDKGDHQGFTESDPVYVPDSTKPSPGARDLNDPSWIRKDMEYKENTVPRVKYY